MKRTGTSNPHTEALITFLNKKDQPAIYRRVSKMMNFAERKRRVINVDQLDRIVNDGDVVVFPAKILGTGVISKKITIGAYNFSAEAKRKIEAAGGQAMTMMEFYEKNPKGTNVRLLKGAE